MDIVFKYQVSQSVVFPQRAVEHVHLVPDRL